MARTNPADTKPTKLACGHVVADCKISGDGDLGWCPTCKRSLFTGWPEHLERNAKLAGTLKAATLKYLDECIATGVQPRLAAIVGACESHVTAASFGQGHRHGGAIDGD